jgi:putative oxidoreductase
MTNRIADWLDAQREWGPVFVRLFAGVFLIYMSQDNVFSWARMEEFARFLGQFGFPVPLFCAVLSVAAQFLAGLLFLAGAFVRESAAVMVVNFVVALVMVHPKLPFREALDPSAMLASALCLLFTGAGRLSVDHWRRAK